MNQDTDKITTGEKLRGLKEVALYRPFFTVAIAVLGTAVAILEAVGLSFISPIIRIANQSNPSLGQGPILDIFIITYDTLGIPFSIGYLIAGVCLIMTVRFTLSFIFDWLSSIVQYSYERHLRSESFNRVLRSETEYFDTKGSDHIMNAIITETRYSGEVIGSTVRVLRELLLASMYLFVMLYISPIMFLFAFILLGGITILIRRIIEPATDVGDRVASANERVQEIVQSGTQGIRDVKLYGLREKITDRFSVSIDKYTRESINLDRNQSIVKNMYDLAAAVSLFTLIYVGFSLTNLTVNELGVFLFAMFRLSPIISRLNGELYSVEGDLAHLIRTQKFIGNISEKVEPLSGKSIDTANEIEFNNVDFSYNEHEDAINDISFDIKKGDFVAFVGQSGAGKSTVVSLLCGLYKPDSGSIKIDGTKLDELDITEWRERIAVVRQNPYIFDDTLRENILIGNENATEDDLERVCEIARIDEFVDTLPDGYESNLGDKGVRLSGGQKQRVALARALLKDADFLILDEATSDLDSSLESQVQESIESMDREYGIITIAHRLSTVTNADRIYTLDNGEIIESGTHNELIKQNGVYSELIELQSSQQDV